MGVSFELNSCCRIERFALLFKATGLSPPLEAILVLPSSRTQSESQGERLMLGNGRGHAVDDLIRPLRRWVVHTLSLMLGEERPLLFIPWSIHLDSSYLPHTTSILPSSSIFW